MSDEDIWATAEAFIRDFGDLAVNEALNAAETICLDGAAEEADDWLKVAAAIEQLQLDKLANI